jgi:hypothetical protein
MPCDPVIQENAQRTDTQSMNGFMLKTCPADGKRAAAGHDASALAKA